MRDKAEAMVLCSFVADSLALGVHWIYDTTQLAAEHGRVEDFLSPKKNPYHANREKGGFTHYGDQALVLLESVSACNGFANCGARNFVFAIHDRRDGSGCKAVPFPKIFQGLEFSGGSAPERPVLSADNPGEARRIGTEIR